MATTPTNKPIPSNDLNDFRFNCEKVDEIVNSDSEKYTDRFGVERYTIDGVRKNLIPLGKQYMTLSDAQADIANIPVNSYTYVRDASGTSLALEYQNVAGTLTATGRAMPSQQSVDKASKAVDSGLNVLFDPLFEVLLSNPTVGSKTHIVSGTLTAALSTNAKLGFPAIVAGPDAGAIAARRLWLADCAVAVGDTISLNVIAWYANAGGRVAFVFRNASGTAIGTQDLLYATGTGFNRYLRTLTVPSGAVMLDVRVENTANAGTVELDAVFLMSATSEAHPTVPGRPVAPYAVPLQNNVVTTSSIQKAAVTVDKASFFIPGVNLFDKAAVTSGYYVNYTTGNLIYNASYSASDYIPVTAGQNYTQSFSHQTAFYDANKTYISGVNALVSPSTARTLTIPAGAVYVRMSVVNTALNKMQFEKGNESTSYQPYALQLDPSLIPTTAAPVVDYVERAYQLRVTRMKLGQLEAGVSAILNVGIFGDSWGTLTERFAKPLAKAIRAKYGSGPGVGWVSFGRHSTSASIINGNIFSVSSNLPTQFTWTGSWLFSYSGTKNPTNSSPDTAVVTSSTPGDALKATVPGTSDGGWSTCRRWILMMIFRFDEERAEWPFLLSHCHYTIYCIFY
jgi:hypothetical protein